jgi:hypothetical protein
MKRRILLLAAFALIAAMASAQSYGYNLASSPTSGTTGGLFSEAADQYLNVLFFGEIDVPVFFFKYSPAPSSNFGASLNSPFEVGMGAWWTKSIYAGGYYSMDGQTYGQLGGGSASSQTQNTTVFTTGGLPTGSSAVITQSVGYLDYLLQNPVLIAGIKLGAMQIGVYNNFRIENSPITGTFDPTTQALASDTNTSIYTGYGAAETLVSALSTEYALGLADNSVLQDILRAGISMPLMANLKAYGLVEVDFSSNGNDQSFASEYIDRQLNSTYADFTPTTALPGATAAALTALRSYTYRTYDYANTNINLSPQVAGGVEYTFPLLGQSAVAGGGFYYDGTFTMRSGSLNDAAGAEQSVTGPFTSTYLFDRDVVLGGAGENQVTTTTTRGFSGYGYTGEGTHTFGVPLSLTMEPSPLVAFGLGVTPSYTVNSSAYAYSGTTISEVVYDNGNGIAPGLDPLDTRTRTTTISTPYTVDSAENAFNLGFTTGVKVFIVPKRLRLNLGATVNARLFDRTNTTTTYTGVGTATTEVWDYAAATPGWVPSTTTPTITYPGTDFTETDTDAASISSTSYDLGLTFFLNPNVMIDLAARSTEVLNLIDTTDGGGLFNLENYVIQLTIKLPPATSAAAGK